MKALISLLLFLPCLAFADVSVPRSKQYAAVVYDVSVLGGATAVPSNAINLGASLPAGAIITDFYVYINTQFASSGSESLAIQCAGTRDLMDYTSIKNVAADRLLASRVAEYTFNGASSLVPTGVASPLNFAQGFGSVPSGCNLTAVLRGDAGQTAYTAGKLTAIVEYFRQP